MTLGRRHVGRTEVLCLGGLALGTIWSVAVAIVAPYFLYSHPVGVELLGGTTLSVISAGAAAEMHKTTLLTASLAAVLAIVRFSPFYWWAGRRYGHLFIDAMGMRNPRAQRGLEKAENYFRKMGGAAVVLAYFLPVPNGLIFAIAGWTGMGFWTFLVYDFLDAILYSTFMAVLGYELGGQALHVAHLISRYASLSTVAITFLLVIGLAVRRVRSTRSQTQTFELPAARLPSVVSASTSLPEFARPYGLSSEELSESLTASLDERFPVGEGLGHLVGAVVTPGGEALVIRGANGMPSPWRGGTYMELGSLTKLFTAALLASEIVEGNLDPDSPFGLLHPGIMQGTRFHGHRLSSFSEFVTHTSGLPTMSVMQLLRSVGNPDQPYIGFSEKHLMTLAARTCGRASGYVYSSLGYSLLALGLCGSTTEGYRQELNSKVLPAMGLQHTKPVAAVLVDESRLGGRRIGRSVADWDPGILTPALGLVSTPEDLLALLRISAGLAEGPFSAKMKLMQRTRVINGDSSLALGLGWHIFSSDRGQLLSHPVRGPRTCGAIFVDPSSGTGVLAIGDSGDSSLQMSLERWARRVQGDFLQGSALRV